MSVRNLVALAMAGASLGACSTLQLPPTAVVRYHLGEPIARGTIIVQPATGGAPASIEFKTYAAAVETELYRNGYGAPAVGATPELVAEVAFLRANRVGPPRSSPVSIGIGGGGFSGGRRGGGVGLGGGVGFPIGGGGNSAIVATELKVTIKRRIDQSPVWEGSAQAYADANKPDATAATQAGRLASALFTGFPGESGRTIEVK